MDEQQMRRDMEKVSKVLTDKTAVLVSTQIGQLWLMISTMQLATRHPGMAKAMRAEIEQIGRQLSRAIVEMHPEVADILEMGWQPEHDVEQ